MLCSSLTDAAQQCRQRSLQIVPGVRQILPGGLVLQRRLNNTQGLLDLLNPGSGSLHLGLVTLNLGLVPLPHVRGPLPHRLTVLRQLLTSLTRIDSSTGGLGDSLLELGLVLVPSHNLFQLVLLLLPLFPVVDTDPVDVLSPALEVVTPPGRQLVDLDLRHTARTTGISRQAVPLAEAESDMPVAPGSPGPIHRGTTRGLPAGVQWMLVPSVLPCRRSIRVKRGNVVAGTNPLQAVSRRPGHMPPGPLDRLLRGADRVLARA